nr:hypothetical protein [Rhizobium leguminosarum]
MLNPKIVSYQTASSDLDSLHAAPFNELLPFTDAAIGAIDATEYPEEPMLIECARLDAVRSDFGFVRLCDMAAVTRCSRIFPALHDTKLHLEIDALIFFSSKPRFYR